MNEKSEGENSVDDRRRSHDGTHVLTELAEQQAMVKLGRQIATDLAEKVANLIPPAARFLFTPDITRRIGLDISQIFLELSGSLNLSGLPLNIRFEKFTDPSAARIVLESGVPKAIEINTMYLVVIAEDMSQKRGIQALSGLRRWLAHEMYHAYAARHFPISTARSVRATADKQSNPAEYDSDRGEVAADLFAALHLENQPQESEDQARENRRLAINVLENVNSRVRNARIKNLLVNWKQRLFSSLNR